MRIKGDANPGVLLQAALIKFKVKKSTARTKQLAMFTAFGEPLDTQAAVARLEPMQELILLPREESATAFNSTARKPRATLPHELLTLILAFVPLPDANPFALLLTAACSKAWHAAVIAKYGTHGDTPCGHLGCRPLGVWYWASVAPGRPGQTTAPATWTRYAADTSERMEDAYRRGASEAKLEVHEPEQSAAGGAKKKGKGGGAGRRRVCVIDYDAMVQRNASRKGRAIALLRAPRTLETIAATALTPEAARARAPERWRQVLKL